LMAASLDVAPAEPETPQQDVATNNAGIASGEADTPQRAEWQVAQADALPFIPSHMWTRMQQKGISPAQIGDALNGTRVLQPNGNTACTGAAVVVILSPSGGFVTCYWK
jgi:hypothetical protein